MTTQYRIVEVLLTDPFNGNKAIWFEVERKRWWLPVWGVMCRLIGDCCSAPYEFDTEEAATQFIRREKAGVLTLRRSVVGVL